MRIGPLVTGAIAVAVCTLFFSATANAQIRINGGSPLMTLTTGVAGGDLIPATNTNCSLRWRRQDVLTKITVSNSCPGQRFTLHVVAINVTQGIATPQVQLTASLADTDFIVNIPAGGAVWKTATLQYTASATFAQGNSDELGIDQNQITYTVVAQ